MRSRDADQRHMLNAVNDLKAEFSLRGAWLLGGRTTRLDYLQQAVDRVAGR